MSFLGRLSLDAIPADPIVQLTMVAMALGGIVLFGAITYFNNIHLLDTYGLGSIEVAKLRKEDHGKFTDNKKLQAYIYNTAKLQDIEVALVFDEWVKMPDYFSKVGTLTIQNNYMAGGTTVSFYAVKKENTDKLRNQLVEFSKQTPKDVIINIIK